MRELKAANVGDRSQWRAGFEGPKLSLFKPGMYNLLVHRIAGEESQI